MVDWRSQLSTRPIPATTGGRSGSSCSSTSAGLAVQEEARRSTGARSTRPCSPTSRSSPARASAAARRSSSGFSSSGSSGSPTTRSGCSTTSTWIDWSETTQDGAAELDRRSRRRRDRLPCSVRRAASDDAGERDDVGDPRLHDAAGHGVRRDVHGARARAPAGGRAHDRARSASTCEAYRERAAKQDLVDPQGRQGEDRRLHRRVRDQPGDRRSRSRSGSPTTC